MKLEQYIEIIYILEKKYGKLSGAAQSDTIKRLQRLATTAMIVGDYITACHEAGKVLTGLEVDMALMKENGPVSASLVPDEPETTNEESLVEYKKIVKEDEWPF